MNNKGLHEAGKRCSGGAVCYHRGDEADCTNHPRQASVKCPIRWPLTERCRAFQAVTTGSIRTQRSSDKPLL